MFSRKKRFVMELVTPLGRFVTPKTSEEIVEKSERAFVDCAVNGQPIEFKFGRGRRVNLPPGMVNQSLLIVRKA